MTTLEKFCFALVVTIMCLMGYKLWHGAIDLGDAQRKADPAPVEFTTDSLTLTNESMGWETSAAFVEYLAALDRLNVALSNLNEELTAMAHAHRTNRVWPGVRSSVNTNRFPLHE